MLNYPVIVGVGMMGDRVSIVLTDPADRFEREEPMLKTNQPVRSHA